MSKERTPEEKVADQASRSMVVKGAADGVVDTFARADAQGTACKFGSQGGCCRVCHMGPCRITRKSPRGVCGADAATIAARNLLAEVAAGTAAHSDHARHLVLLLKEVGEGHGGDYQVRDEQRLRTAARRWSIEEQDLDTPALAVRFADLMLDEFSRISGPAHSLRLAPLPRQQLWERADLAPSGIDPAVVQALHRTNIGVDQHYKSLLRAALRTSIADGWAGSMIATTVSDILFGTPRPVRSRVNLGVLSNDQVNVVVHGHDPALTEMLVVASRDPALLAEAAEAGAAGINLVGICCTANEVLMRHGVAVAGNFLQQELALVTGAVELMITDVQCCMASLPEVARCYHTKVLTTSPLARNVGAEPVIFDEADALASSRAILRQAVANFPRRDPDKVAIPDEQSPLVAGFSNEAIFDILGGRFRRSFRPLNDAIITGRIQGVCGVVGCTNARRGQADSYITRLTRELIARNILVLQTGCAAVACAKEGLLTPEAALELAGPSLREVCEAVGIPPVLHMGSCVDNSRMLMAATYLVEEGGLGQDLSDLPAIGVAPEWMSQKAVAIGHYFVASGIDVVLGHPFHTLASEEVTRFLCEELEQEVGATFHYIEDVDQAVEVICAHIQRKRKALGIDRQAQRKLFDMKDRRSLGV